jgi:hypothetical protein
MGPGTLVPTPDTVRRPRGAGPCPGYDRRMSERLACIVCGTPDCQRDLGPDIAVYDCPRCGSFVLTGTAEAVLPDKLAEEPARRSRMSHTLRRMQRPGQRPFKIGSDELSSFWNDPLPTPLRQADLLIMWIGDNEPIPFIPTPETPVSVIAATVGLPVFRKGDSFAFQWLDAELRPKELYRRGGSAEKPTFLLTLSGWEKYEALKHINIESRTAFMAMKFGEPVLDQVISGWFRPAVARAGFELRLLTDEQPAGLIDDQLRAAILSARFLVADLTHGSHGAYWEAGFAEGLNLPVIYTCEASHWNEYKTHFDTNHMKTIIWDTSDLERAGRELTATIRATLRAEAKQTDDPS